MKNNNKNTDKQWTHRLFKEAFRTKAPPQNKSNFSHHYRDSRLENVAFRELFENNNQNLLTVNALNSDFQELFKQRVSNPSNKNVVVHTSNKTEGQTNLSATDNSLCHNEFTDKCLVLNSHNETWDTKTFRLELTSGQAFDYLPGQFITITVEIEGQQYHRSYSLASSPIRTGYLEITVKRDSNGGIVSNWLNDNLKEGDSLAIKGPYGRFTCANVVPDKILILAAGSGVVPIMSMLRWLIDTNARTDVVLLLSFKTQYDIIFGDELKLIASRYNNIKVVITLTQEPINYSQWLGLTGRITKKMMACCVPEVSEREVYQCGPSVFMSQNNQHLQALGVPETNLHSESFTVNTSNIPDSVTKPTFRLEQQTKQLSGGYLVRFAKSEKTVTVGDTSTLLEIAEQSGIVIGHECRSGNCGECMVKCLEGDIEMTMQAEIDDIDRKKGWVYACCAHPVSNVVLDL